MVMSDLPSLLMRVALLGSHIQDQELLKYVADTRESGPAETQNHGIHFYIA